MACFNTLYPIIRVHIIPPNVDKCDAIHGSNICVSIETIGIHYYESLQYKLIVIVEWVGLNHRVLLTLLPFWLRHLLMRLNMCPTQSNAPFVPLSIAIQCGHHTCKTVWCPHLFLSFLCVFAW
eukprot:698070_1